MYFCYSLVSKMHPSVCIPETHIWREDSLNREASPASAQCGEEEQGHTVYQPWVLRRGNTQGCDRGTGAPGLHGEEQKLPPVTGGSPLVEEPRRASSCYQYFTTPWTASYAQLFHVQKTRKCSYLQHGCPYRLTVFWLEPHSFGLFWVAFKNLWSAVGFFVVCYVFDLSSKSTFPGLIVINTQSYFFFLIF